MIAESEIKNIWSTVLAQTSRRSWVQTPGCVQMHLCAFAKQGPTLASWHFFCKNLFMARPRLVSCMHPAFGTGGQHGEPGAEGTKREAWNQWVDMFFLCSKLHRACSWQSTFFFCKNLFMARPRLVSCMHPALGTGGQHGEPRAEGTKREAWNQWVDKFFFAKAYSWPVQKWFPACTLLLAQAVEIGEPWAEGTIKQTLHIQVLLEAVGIGWALPKAACSFFSPFWVPSI